MSLKNRGAAGMAVLTAIMVLIAADVRAQSRKEVNLSDIKTLKCTFPTSMIAVWKDGVPEPRVRATSVLVMEINEIDTAGGSAIVGSVSNGNHDVSVQVYGWSLHVLEASRSGRIGMTTVFAQHSTGERLKAVHTKTDYLPVELPNYRSEPQVVQYYGDCEAGR